MMLLALSTRIDAKEEKIKLSRPEKELIEPETKVIKDKEGNEYGGYDIEGIKKVGIIFEHYHLLWDYSLSLEMEISSLKKEIVYLKAQVSLWKEATKEQTARGNFYLESWRKQGQLFLKREKEQNKYRWLPWGLIVIEAAALILSLSLNISE